MGIAAIEMVNAEGAISIATTRTSKKKVALAGVGAAHVIATEEEDFLARVNEITGGKGARIIFDPIAGKGVELLVQAAAPGGTIFEYGALAPEPTPFPLFPALAKGLSIRGYTLREILSIPDLKAKAEKYGFDHIRDRRLQAAASTASFRSIRSWKRTATWSPTSRLARSS